MTQPELIAKSGMGYDMPDVVKIVRVSGGGSRHGVASIPECLILDRRIKSLATSVYLNLSIVTSDNPVKFFRICNGIPSEKVVDAITQLHEYRYIDAKISDDNSELIIKINTVYPHLAKDGMVIGMPYDQGINTANIDRVVGTQNRLPRDRYTPETAKPANTRQEIWDEYIKYRRENGFSVRKGIIVRQSAFVVEQGPDGEEVLKTTMLNGWRGLFPVKSSARTRQTTQILHSVQKQSFEDEI